MRRDTRREGRLVDGQRFDTDHLRRRAIPKFELAGKALVTVSHTRPELQRCRTGTNVAYFSCRVQATIDDDGRPSASSSPDNTGKWRWSTATRRPKLDEYNPGSCLQHIAFECTVSTTLFR